MSSLLLRSLRFYWPTHLMVLLGVTIAVAVLTGALLVGRSVRASLRELAVGRLGATDAIVSATGFVREDLADRLAASPDFDRSLRAVTPLIAIEGAATHEPSGRTASRIQVFGIDERFGRFHGVDAPNPTGRQAFVSPGLAAELGAAASDSLLLRIAKPTDIPLGALQGRRDEASERIRMEIAGVLDAGGLGEFSLAPSQGPAFTIFVPLARLQRDLDLEGRVNTIIASVQPGAPPRTLESIVAATANLDDLGLRLRHALGGRTLVLESRSGLVPPGVADAARAAGAELGAHAVPVLSYLANAIRANGREVPYSLVAAIGGDSSGTAGTALPVSDSGIEHPIWLNQWAADDLGIAPGAPVTLTYYLWSDVDGLTTGEASFTMAGVVPMEGAGGDATLTPEYPGVTDADNVTNWDPPFPVDLRRVGPRDEQYWDDWRAAPKAFLPLDRGQTLWPSPFGIVSSVRFTTETSASAGFADALTTTLLRRIDPFTAGIAVRQVRADAIAAAEGTTDFGEYFLYFSVFLVASALILTYLFFTLNLEQRTRELGLLTAVGFTPRDLSRHFLAEGALLTGVGMVLGIAGAIGYAALILHGLRTWWIGAVGTRALTLHVDPLAALGGAVLAALVALGAIALGLRRLRRRTARSLLTGAAASGLVEVEPTRVRRRTTISLVMALLGLAAVAAAGTGVLPDVAAFFLAGACALVAGLAAASAWLWRGTIGGSLALRPRSILRLGIRQTAWKPGQSVSSLALIAFACFVLVAVGAFRRDPSGASLDRGSGTGGFTLMAESVAPLMYDPNTRAGRESLGLPDDPRFSDVRVSRVRLRPGDESSCLTLYRPATPRLIAPENAFLDENRFAFSAALADTAEERANPWRLLHRRFDDGAIPAIADQTSLAYVFHLKVGDDFVFTPGAGSAPIRLRIVGALADSVLQSEVIIGEPDFLRLFPRQEGYRVWLVEAPPERSAELSTLFEDGLSDFGVDVVDTRQRLAAYHEVENTYLSTFQALGGLGLLVGTIGLGAVLARNVLERRREIGLLGAVGFEARHLRTIVLAESGALVAGGLLLGTGAALLAVWPALGERAQALPIASLAIMLAAVAATAFAASIAAVRAVGSMSVVEAVKAE